MREQAERYFVGGHFSRAGELYLALALQSPDDVMLRLRHAECARRVGNTLAAVASFRTAAKMLALCGDPSRARKALRVALALAPGHAELERELRFLQPEALSHELVPLPIEVAAPEPLVTDVLELPPLYPSLDAAPELRRIDAMTLAIRRADGSGWYLVHSTAPLHVEEVRVEDDAELDLEIVEETP